MKRKGTDIMAFEFFTQDLGIDLGTSNVLI